MKDNMIFQFITKGNKIADRPQLIHDKGNWGVQIGVLVGYTQINKRNVEEIYIGYSLKNKKEWEGQQFSTAKEKRNAKYFHKDIAINLAIDKSLELSVIEIKLIEYDRLLEEFNKIPKTVTKQLLMFMDRCERYYKGVDLSLFWKQVKIMLERR
jgi:hypothetical protein